MTSSKFAICETFTFYQFPAPSDSWDCHFEWHHFRYLHYFRPPSLKKPLFMSLPDNGHHLWYIRSTSFPTAIKKKNKTVNYVTSWQPCDLPAAILITSFPAAILIDLPVAILDQRSLRNFRPPSCWPLFTSLPSDKRPSGRHIRLNYFVSPYWWHHFRPPF